MMVASAAIPDGDDPWAWLEEVDSERALDWVRAHNAQSQGELEATPEYRAIHERLLTIYDSSARIPSVVQRGAYWYNFWQDAGHPRGLWRRTTPAEYRKAEPAWETVLDIDALAEAEQENWVWAGPTCLWPEYRRCLIHLSRGGGDAVVVREFDLQERRFVDDGFRLPEAKSTVAWRNDHSLYVGTDFGPGSMTDSGYPRSVREWTRGTPLAEARLVFEGAAGDVSVGAYVHEERGFPRELIHRGLSFYEAENLLRVGDSLLPLAIPEDAQPGFWREWLTVELRSDWAIDGRVWPAGALLAIPLDSFLDGGRAFSMLYTPGPRKSLAGVSELKTALVVNELDQVRNRLYVLRPREQGWTREPLPAPEFGSVDLAAVDSDESDAYFLSVTDYLTPTRLEHGVLGESQRELLKALPAFFRADGLEIAQHEARSKDGTLIPYFQVSRKGVALDGRNPTLLYGYGGFEVSMTPGYDAANGAGWLERGGVYVVANIRGGGEFGPEWHQAALKEHRQRAYDDFIAVAEDLIARKLTSPGHLGIQGGSNGGLLMGVMLTQRPELFGAVVCEVPLLDMRRYSKLLAGASWMGEYGDPDRPEEWAWIAKYSPYQNLREDAKYPPVLFTTSTRDDRVHPGHARKMAARMEAQGHAVLYYENIEGGHGGAANNAQRAQMDALACAFLWQQLR